MENKDLKPASVFHYFEEICRVPRPSKNIKSVFLLITMLRWASDNDKWSIVIKGSNIFNEGFSTKSVQGNQDYHMNIKQDWASASISIIYKIGKYKEKRTKDVDTSRMGAN